MGPNTMSKKSQEITSLKNPEGQGTSTSSNLQTVEKTLSQSTQTELKNKYFIYAHADIHLASNATFYVVEEETLKMILDSFERSLDKGLHSFNCVVGLLMSIVILLIGLVVCFGIFLFKRH